MHTITRRFVFDAAHRVLGHQGKCRHMHGHRYVAEVTCRASKLNELGMVIDFSVVKERVGSWIDETLDHTTILNAHDPWRLAVWNEGDVVVTDENPLWERDPFIMPNGENPTAENIAKLIYTYASNVLPDSIIVFAVKLWETENCFAMYAPPDASPAQ